MSEAVLPMRLRQFRFGAERSRSGAKIGLAGWAFMAATSVAAVALVLGPLSMLLIVAFRGPQDLLPFEQGAQWTLRKSGGDLSRRQSLPVDHPRYIYLHGWLRHFDIRHRFCAGLAGRAHGPAVARWHLHHRAVSAAGSWHRFFDHLDFSPGAQHRLGQRGAACHARARWRRSAQHIQHGRHDPGPKYWTCAVRVLVAVGGVAFHEPHARRGQQCVWRKSAQDVPARDLARFYGRACWRR